MATTASYYPCQNNCNSNNINSVNSFTFDNLDLDNLDHNLFEMFSDLSDESLESVNNGTISTISDKWESGSDASTTSSDQTTPPAVLFQFDSAYTYGKKIKTEDGYDEENADGNRVGGKKYRSLLLSTEVDEAKRQKIETRLLKNRESANKSRAKKKLERINMEKNLVEITKRVGVLEEQNEALRAENMSLSSANEMLKSALAEKDRILSKLKPHLPHAMTGITVLCVVCMCSLFCNAIFPTTSFMTSDDHYGSSGRVLLSYGEEVASSSNMGRVMSHGFLILVVYAAYSLFATFSNQSILSNNKKYVLPS